MDEKSTPEDTTPAAASPSTGSEESRPGSAHSTGSCNGGVADIAVGRDQQLINFTLPSRHPKPRKRKINAVKGESFLLNGENLAARQQEKERLERLEKLKRNVSETDHVANVASVAAAAARDPVVVDLDDSEDEDEGFMKPSASMLKKEYVEVIDVSSGEEELDETHSVGRHLLQRRILASYTHLSGRSRHSTADREKQENAQKIEKKRLEKKMNLDVDSLIRGADGRLIVNAGKPDDEPDVSVADHLTHILQPHQLGGVRFMYDNVVESLTEYKRTREEGGFGCILAHSMGLGKTLQVITFTEVFFRATQAKTVLVITPINTIQNWLNEYNRWMPMYDDHGERLRQFEVFILGDNAKTYDQRVELIEEWGSKGGVLLIGYDMFRLLVNSSKPKKTRAKIAFLGGKKVAEATPPKKEDDHTAGGRSKKEANEAVLNFLVSPGPDLVICDEGHKIKNLNTDISTSLSGIRTRRRVVLTGYPLQNNLMEYYCMVNFVRPDYLGTKKSFSQHFERPIRQGQCVDSTASDIKLARQRTHVLIEMLRGFVQRRTQHLLRQILPESREYVVLLRKSAIQHILYRAFVLSAMAELEQGTSNNFNPLKAFALCSKFWNHPDVLYRCLQKLREDREADKERAAKEKEKEAAAAAQTANAAASSMNFHHQSPFPPQQPHSLFSPFCPPSTSSFHSLPHPHSHPFLSLPQPQQHLLSMPSSPHLPMMHSSTPSPFFYLPQSPHQFGQFSSPPLPNPPWMQFPPMSGAPGSSGGAGYQGWQNGPQGAMMSGVPSPMGGGNPGFPQQGGNGGMPMWQTQLNGMLPPQQTQLLPTPQQFSQPTPTSTPALSHPPTPSAQPKGNSKVAASPSRRKEKQTLASVLAEELELDPSVKYDWAETAMASYVAGVVENGPKMLIALALIDAATQRGEKLLLFSQNLATLTAIEAFLGKRKLLTPHGETNWIKNTNYFRFDGSTGATDREKLINKFNSDSSVYLFLISTKAGSLGVNLVSASRCILFDACWNPCHDAQAVCRIFRYGQQRRTYIYRLIMDNSMEKSIFNRQVSKQGLQQRVVDEQHVDANVTRSELEKLLVYDESLDVISSDHNVSSWEVDDDILKLVAHHHQRIFAQEPFLHESLMLEREEGLSEQEKEEARLLFEKEKAESETASRLGLSYPLRGIPTAPQPSFPPPPGLLAHRMGRMSVPQARAMEPPPLRTTPLPFSLLRDDTRERGRMLGGGATLAQPFPRINIPNRRPFTVRGTTGAIAASLSQKRAVLIDRDLELSVLGTPEQKVLVPKGCSGVLFESGQQRMLSLQGKPLLLANHVDFSTMIEKPKEAAPPASSSSSSLSSSSSSATAQSPEVIELD